jgi:hypothetical protein
VRIGQLMSSQQATDPRQLGRRIRFDGHVVLAGSCSWTDRALLEQASWYPRRTMSAEERHRISPNHSRVNRLA